MIFVSIFMTRKSMKINGLFHGFPKTSLETVDHYVDVWWGQAF
jgi:hypothetical protein